MQKILVLSEHKTDLNQCKAVFRARSLQVKQPVHGVCFSS